MCHNKLQPSKVAKEWRNIPLFKMKSYLLEVSNKVLTKLCLYIILDLNNAYPQKVSFQMSVIKIPNVM